MVQSDTVGRCLAFSRDGTRVAAVVRNVVTLWDVSKREELLAVHGRTIAFSPDGTRLASSEPDLTARAWPRTPGSEIVPLNAHRCDCTVGSDDHA
jgi:WD40 repeat protein